MYMTDDEIIREYKQSKDKFEQVKILADENLVSPKMMAIWLTEHGQPVDGRYFGNKRGRGKLQQAEAKRNEYPPDPRTDDPNIIDFIIQYRLGWEPGSALVCLCDKNYEGALMHIKKAMGNIDDG